MVTMTQKDAIEMLLAAYLNCSNVDQRDGVRKVISAWLVLMRKEPSFGVMEERSFIKQLERNKFTFVG